MTDHEETPLERMLRDAWHEPGLRPAFYKRLLTSDVLVPVQPRLGQALTGKIDAGEILNVITFVRNDQVSVIPFYSSPEHLFKASPAGEKCVLMRVRELFQSRRDMHFHLNPFSHYGREFNSHEVVLLLETGTLDHSVKEFVPDGERIKLTSPKNPPRDLLNALGVLFARNFQVRTAFAADLTRPDKAIDKTLLIGIELTSERERIFSEAATIVNDFIVPGLTVDLAAIERDDTKVSKYFFGEAAPFYEASLTARLISSMQAR